MPPEVAVDTPPDWPPISPSIPSTDIIIPPPVSADRPPEKPI